MRRMTAKRGGGRENSEADQVISMNFQPVAGGCSNY